MAFQAKYGGNCGRCTERIKPGQLVTYVDDELVHADCPDDAVLARSVPARPEVTCTECWLIKPCECDDGRAA